jgi:hypothetical protein
MLKLIGVILLAIPMSMLAVVAGTGLMVVDVREGGPGGHHFIVPVPLILAEAALSFAPRHDMHLERPELKQFLPAARQILNALADAPDGELVSVDERDEHVRITKAGGVLKIRVTSSRENVSVDVPFAMAQELLGGVQDGTLTPMAVAGALRHTRFTTLAEVHDGNDHVKVSVW